MRIRVWTTKAIYTYSLFTQQYQCKKKICSYEKTAQVRKRWWSTTSTGQHTPAAYING